LPSGKLRRPVVDLHDWLTKLPRALRKARRCLPELRIWRRGLGRDRGRRFHFDLLAGPEPALVAVRH
jgi:hypothetical protein